MKKAKQALSILLSVLLVALTLSCLAACFIASGLDATGKCGPDVNWTFNSSTGVLTITGTGDMYSYGQSDWSPFYHCDEIRTVNFNNGVTDVGDHAFNFCENLTTVNLAFSTKKIGYEAFGSCLGLTNVTLPDQVGRIDPSAFYNCTGLKSIFIPSYVTLVDNRAFDRCSALTDVYYGGNAEQWMNINIAGSNDSLKNATKHWNSTLSYVQITAKADPTGGGTVGGGGSYLKNREVTLVATPKRGYTFTGWYRSGVKVNSNASYSFNATGNVTLTAKFESGYTVTVNVTPSGAGTVTGGGTFAPGEITQLEATPNPGYVFVGFINEAGEFLKFVNRFMVTKDVTYTAKFMSTSNLSELKYDTDSLQNGDWYFDTEAFLEAMANNVGWSVEDLRPMYAEAWQENVIKFDPASGLIVIGPAGDTNYADQTATCPEDDGYSIYRNAIKVYQDSTQPDPGTPESVCPWCGGQHVGFFQGIIGWFHSILAKIFGARY